VQNTIKLINNNLTKQKPTMHMKRQTELQRKICLRVLMYLVEICVSHQSLASTELSLPIRIPYTIYQYGVRRRKVFR